MGWTELGEGRPGAFLARQILHRALADLGLLQEGVEPSEPAPQKSGGRSGKKQTQNQNQKEKEKAEGRELCPKCGILEPKPEGFVCAITACPKSLVLGPVEIEEATSELNEKPSALLADALAWFLNPDKGPCSLNFVSEILNTDPDVWTFTARQYVENPNRRKLLVPNGRKLDPVKDKPRILELVKGGLSTRQIGELFRVDRSVISKIKNGLLHGGAGKKPRKVAA